MREAPTLVLVTHHLEEIPSFVTHVLLLAGGQVVASGPVSEVLTGAGLTRAFGVPCEVRVEGPGRYSLRIQHSGDR